MSFSIFESLYPSKNDVYRCKYDAENNTLIFPMIGERCAMTLDEIKDKIQEKCMIIGKSDGCNCAMTFLEDMKNDDALKNKISIVEMNVPYDKMNTKTSISYFVRVYFNIVNGVWDELEREDEIDVPHNLTREQINNSRNDIVIQKEKRNPILNGIWNYVARPLITGLFAVALAIFSTVSLPIIGTVMLGKSIYNRVHGVDNSKYTQDIHIANRISDFLRNNTEVKGEIKYTINDREVGDLGLVEKDSQDQYKLKEEFKNIPNSLQINVYDNEEHECLGTPIFSKIKDTVRQSDNFIMNNNNLYQLQYQSSYRGGYSNNENVDTNPPIKLKNITDNNENTLMIKRNNKIKQRHAYL